MNQQTRPFDEQSFLERSLRAELSILDSAIERDGKSIPLMVKREDYKQASRCKKRLIESRRRRGDVLRLLEYYEAELGAMRGEVAGVRWHRLSETRQGDYLTELLACTCEDGIVVIARWGRLADGRWRVEAMDSENGEWEVVRHFGDGEVVPGEPPVIFDDRSWREGK